MTNSSHHDGLLVYRERYQWRKSVYESDGVELRVTRRPFLERRTRTSIPLANLVGDPVWGTVRPSDGRLLRVALAILTIGSWLLLVLLSSGPERVAFSIAFGLICLWALYSELSDVEHQYVVFHGEKPLIITRAGPDAVHFESFVEALSEQILQARESNQTAGGFVGSGSAPR